MTVRLIRQLTFAALLLIVQACTSLPQHSIKERVPVPDPWYDWGSWQLAEDFADIEVAQSAILMRKGDERHWTEIRPWSRPTARFIGLQRYHPMQARWKLKDGRQFVLRNIDIESILRTYFSSNPMIPTQWQRESRKLSPGDAPLTLTHSIRGDTLYIKWALEVNLTPVEKRIAPSGAANPWKFETEAYPIASFKGTPTSGIDFSKTDESEK